jgi:hypothetical protein
MGRCQANPEENVLTHSGVASDVQGIQEGRDDELVIFSRESDSRAIEDCKRLKLMNMYQRIELLEA